ncbi:MAG: MarP family serine protease [Geodermatophilaceae bacterium]|nr:MarP family serine protease [Geodermatophilaceae bacterium]
MIDLLLVGLAVLFAVSGWRQGLVVSAASFVGFLGGAVLASQIATPIADGVASSAAGRLIAALAVVLVGAFLGQLALVWLGQEIRRRLTWRPARTLDALLGAGVSALAVLLVAWMIATPLASSGFPSLSREVRGSSVIRTVDDALPSPVRALYDSLRDAIGRRGLPDVLGPLTPTEVIDVPVPDAALAADPEVRAATASVVQVTGVAPACSLRVDGTGFVYAEGRVMTNAHVLAGVRRPQVVVDGESFEATTVLVDAELDVAILAVPGLSAAPLRFDPKAVDTGADAVISGFPGGGPLYVGAARVRDRAVVAGPDFRDEQTVRREVYVLRADIRPGNSGGPLLDTEGEVLGVVFASAVDDPETGYALTAGAVSDAAAAGVTAIGEVSTGDCV